MPERTDRLAVVGSGPSVRDYLDELWDFEGDIWAVNGAYGFLLEHGIIPDAFVGLDPLPGLAEYVACARKETTHYLSGMCDPAVFDALKDFHVVLWFPAQKNVRFRPGTYLVPGGTTCLTRMPALAKMLGWRDVTIYGADSSYAEDRYAYRCGTYGEDSKAEVNRVFCNGEGPFYTEEALLKQASQFCVLAQTTAIKLQFRCGGLLDAALRAPTFERDLHDEYNARINAA